MHFLWDNVNISDKYDGWIDLFGYSVRLVQ